MGEAVSKKTRRLVAADPDSMSGKVRKARWYGIPVLHPVAYRALVAAMLLPA